MMGELVMSLAIIALAVVLFGMALIVWDAHQDWKRRNQNDAR